MLVGRSLSSSFLLVSAGIKNVHINAGIVIKDMKSCAPLSNQLLKTIRGYIEMLVNILVDKNKNVATKFLI